MVDETCPVNLMVFPIGNQVLQPFKGREMPFSALYTLQDPALVTVTVAAQHPAHGAGSWALEGMIVVHTALPRLHHTHVPLAQRADPALLVQ